MNNETIFTVKNEQLSQLDQKTSVEFFQKLLWAEARRLGVEISKISVSSWVNVPDGGVDANVDDAQITGGQGVIKQRTTCYQIKAGDTFKPWQKSAIKNELFGTKTPNKKNLGESIRKCLDNDGAYILVCTGIDPTELNRGKITPNIEDYLKQCGYSNPKVEVFTQSNLKGFLDVYPSLALWVNGNARTNFQTHESWSLDGTMRVQFFPSQSQRELIPKIQDELRGNSSTCHIRVLGEPGIGKTKLVLEATGDDDLSPLVIYCTATEFLTDRFLLNQILRDDNHFSIILVIDECNPNNRFYIWDKLQHRGPRVKLISIYNDYDPIADSSITELEIERLEDDQVLTIIQEYGVIKESAALYLQFCNGSPRMAQHTGKILSSYPGDPSKLLTDDYLYKSFYVDLGKEDVNKIEVQQRELVLRHIALFKRFGFSGSLVDEAKAIVNKIEEVTNSQVNWYKFQEIVDYLRKRKILQGDNTLYITPKALQIKLWVDWWQIYGNSFDYEVFIKDFPPKLIEWFNEMFRYAAESEPAEKIVRELLGPDGPFQNTEFLNTKLGSSFFLALTEAAPQSALKCLMHTIGTLDKDALLEFAVGRRNVVWALEKIAMHKDLFPNASRLLLALGEAENEGYSNNASGVFAGLFSPGPGRVAPTEASPTDRLPILREAFASESKERHRLALKACAEGLESEHFSRMSNAEYQGLRREPNYWKPKTYPEWWDTYRQVWQLLSEQLEHLPDDEREKAVGILLGRAGSLGRIPALGDMIVHTVETITQKKYASEKQIIEIIIRILFQDDSNIDNKGLPTEVRQRFEKIRDELIDSDYHSQMQRYVGMDLVEDQMEKSRDGVDRVQPYLEKLAQQSVEDSALLHSELSWLVTADAKNGDKFGYELGKRDREFSLLSTLLDALRKVDENASTYLLGGYFRSIFERDLTEWEKQLDTLVEDCTLNLLIPDITLRSGLTDRAGLRILKLATRETISIKHFRIFVYGKAIESLSYEVFKAWIEFLLSVPEKSAISTALNLYYCYFFPGKSEQTLPCDFTFQLLTHPLLFEELKGYRYDTMTDYYWSGIARSFLQFYPERSLELADIMITHFGADGTIVGGFEPSTALILSEISKQYPEQVWELVYLHLEHLEIQKAFSKQLSLDRWLREGDISETEKGKGTLTLFPRQKIWEWVNRDVEKHAYILASRLVPKTFDENEWPTSLVRSVLKRYGARDDVRRSLITNYPTDVWTGSASSRYDTIKQKILNIKNSEDNQVVKQWIDQYAKALDHYIEHARIEEERED